jgi:hypothetical protein
VLLSFWILSSVSSVALVCAFQRRCDHPISDGGALGGSLSPPLNLAFVGRLHTLVDVGYLVVEDHVVDILSSIP